MMQRLITRNNVNNLSSVNAFQPLLLFSTSSTTTTVSESFANYLVDSLGFSHQQALSASTRFSLYRKLNNCNFDANSNANANAVVTLFRRYGFNDTHIAKIVSVDPRLLTFNVHNTLYPKFKFLIDHGFSLPDLTRVISARPQLLLHGLDSSISPTLRILRQIMGRHTLVIAVLKRLHPRGYRGIIDNIMPNVDLLVSYGISIELIRKHITFYPVTFSQNPEKFKQLLIRVENQLGIAPDSPMFLYGIDLVSGRSDQTIESKCRMFKSFGWTQRDVETLMMKVPCCFHFSDATIKKKLEFLIDELRLTPAYLISNNAFFTCSLEKRIVFRHKVLLILKDLGLLQKEPSFGTAIRMTDSRFLEMFVIPFREVHQVYSKLNGSSMTLSDSKH